MKSTSNEHRKKYIKTISRPSAWLIGSGSLLILLAVLLFTTSAWTYIMPDSGQRLEFAVTLAPGNTVQVTPVPATETRMPTPQIETATPSPTPIEPDQDSQSDPPPTATATHSATPTPSTSATPAISEAWRLMIPAIDLDTSIVGVGLEIQTISGRRMLTWSTPDFFAAGWHIDSAEPGETGNVVLNGHNNVYGEVFRDLDKVAAGDEITIRADGTDFVYTIVERHIIKDKWVSTETHTENAQWVLPTEEARLTLVTCWPYTSNTHRLIVVAVPAITQPSSHVAE